MNSFKGTLNTKKSVILVPVINLININIVLHHLGSSGTTYPGRDAVIYPGCDLNIMFNITQRSGNNLYCRTL